MMLKAERDELGKILRQRARVAGRMADQRKAELIADSELAAGGSMISTIDDKVLALFEVGGQFNGRSASVQEVAYALNCREGRARDALVRLEWALCGMRSELSGTRRRRWWLEALRREAPLQESMRRRRDASSSCSPTQEQDA